MTACAAPGRPAGLCRCDAHSRRSVRRIAHGSSGPSAARLLMIDAKGGLPIKKLKKATDEWQVFVKQC